MKLNLSLILLLVLVLAFATGVAAEDNSSSTDAAQTADNLRLQLIDLQAKEADLQTRARALEEEMKPENIERALAGVGSTRPEELRELRRRQLNIELTSVRNQLKLLATSRERLDTAIRNADAVAYQQSAEGPSLPVAQVLKGQPGALPTWFFVVGGIGALMAIGLATAILRRRRSAS